MRTIDMRDARPHLSRPVAMAAKGEGFIIARAGKPLVKVMPLDGRAIPHRLGFLTGEIAVPDDFDRMGQDEIARQFSAGA
jgi:antitoxin (DNA-binding transcriptional repressor) of toxin-antitoxin stability system